MISLILILVSIAIPVYNRSILRAKESRVEAGSVHACARLSTIHHGQTRKLRSRSTTLVTAEYLKAVPKDPLTGEANWTSEQEEATDSGRTAGTGNYRCA